VSFFRSLPSATNSPSPERERRVAATLGAMARCCISVKKENGLKQADERWFSVVTNLAVSVEIFPTISTRNYEANPIAELAYAQMKLGQGLIQVGEARPAVLLFRAAEENFESGHPSSTGITNFCKLLSAAAVGAGTSAEGAEIKSLLDRASQVKPTAKIIAPDLMRHEPHPLSAQEAAEERARMNAGAAAGEQRRRALEAAQARAAAEGANAS
jgi:hypothetical protein